MSASLIHEFAHELVLTALMGLAGSVAMYPIKKIMGAYKTTVDKLETVHQELVQQRTNHLTHIESSNEKQVEILSRVATTLEAMHLDQRTLLGRLEK